MHIYIYIYREREREEENTFLHIYCGTDQFASAAALPGRRWTCISKFRLGVGWSLVGEGMLASLKIPEGPSTLAPRTIQGMVFRTRDLK